MNGNAWDGRKPGDVQHGKYFALVNQWQQVIGVFRRGERLELFTDPEGVTHMVRADQMSAVAMGEDQMYADGPRLPPDHIVGARMHVEETEKVRMDPTPSNRTSIGPPLPRPDGAKDGDE